MPHLPRETLEAMLQSALSELERLREENNDLLDYLADQHLDYREDQLRSLVDNPDSLPVLSLSEH